MKQMGAAQKSKKTKKKPSKEIELVIPPPPPKKRKERRRKEKEERKGRNAIYDYKQMKNIDGDKITESYYVKEKIIQ